MLKCNICGSEIETTDHKAIHYEIFSIHGDDKNNGDICGDCVYQGDFFKLWREKKCEN